MKKIGSETKYKFATGFRMYRGPVMIWIIIDYKLNNNLFASA